MALGNSTQHPHRTIIAIAFPAILANSSTPLVGLVDTWAIGHLPGPTYLAAIGLGSVIFNFLLWAFGFLRMGTTGIIAQANGKDDTELLISYGKLDATNNDDVNPTNATLILVEVSLRVDVTLDPTEQANWVFQ